MNNSFRTSLVTIGLLLVGCGQDRYLATANASAENRWSEMMACRQSVYMDHGGPARSFVAGVAGGLGGAAGGAIAGAAAGATSGANLADDIDRCMAAKGYIVSRPNPYR